MSLERARRLDAQDPLARFAEKFVPIADEGVLAYLDGNSLGRPPTATLAAITELVTRQWGNRMIRSWSEGWLELPSRVGDEVGVAALGAAPGQVIVADSTTVCLYKALRGALELRKGRTEIVTDVHNFPTDRYVVEGIAAERGMTVRWVDSDPAAGVDPRELAAAIGPDTAVVTLSHVAYHSAFLADLAAITAAAHDAGALMVWDL
ncbi:MAG: aminotransferase class V-fold PLP-dependent enzyme, partial [Sciscionella sp.]